MTVILNLGVGAKAYFFALVHQSAFNEAEMHKSAGK
jgi:hypothetical protein